MLSEPPFEYTFAMAPLPPPSKRWFLLILASAVIFCFLLGLTIVELRQRHDRELDRALESAHARRSADQESLRVVRDYERGALAVRQDAARAQLARGRAAWKLADERLRTAPGEPDLILRLNEAFQGYSRYLDVFPDDCDVLLERARVHELRRNPDLALKDLERAAALKPSLAPGLQETLTRLRKEVRR